MGFSKTRTVYFAMDTTNSSLSKDLSIMDNIQKKLENAGISVKRISSSNVTQGRGPNAMYSNMKYLYDNNIHDAIMLHLMNGVDPSNIREVAVNGNDNRGKKVRANGNDAILAWFWDACDCVHEGGTCYSSVRASETGSRLYNPLQYMKDNKIEGICVSSDNKKRTGDYTGDKVAEEVIKLFENTTTTTTTTTTSDTDKTIKKKTVEQISSKAFYNQVFIVTTDENGAYSLPVNLGIAGKYIVNHNFAGNKDYNGTSTSRNIENYSGTIFKPELLQTTTTTEYTDGTTDTKVEGSTTGHKHTTTTTSTTTYTNNEETTETTTRDDDTIGISPISKEEETTIVSNPSLQDPYTNIIGLKNDGTPQIELFETEGKTYEMVDTTKTYTLNREQFLEVTDRDSKIMQIQDYQMTQYVSFQCQEHTDKYIVIERERWNAIEESYHYYMVKGTGKKGFAVIPYPKKMYLDFPNKKTVFDDSSTVTWKQNGQCNQWYVADNQNTNYTCGPTSCSVCTQILHKYYSERNLQEVIHATSSSGSSYTTHATELKKLGFTAEVYTGTTKPFEWLKKNKPCTYHVSWHYIALCEIASDEEILVANSTTSSGYGPYTGWRTKNELTNAYGGAGVLIGLNWTITNDEKLKLQNYFQNMGVWKKTETKEVPRYVQLSS